MIDVIAGALLVTGAALGLIAAIGLLRLPDIMTRMHAGTKPQTLGLLLVLAGLALRIPDPGPVTIIVLVAVFQLMTSPVSAHMIGRAAFRNDVADRERLVRDDLSDDT